MATQIDIINNALICLGQLPIDSLSEPNPAIQSVIRLYDMIVQNSFVQHPWKFALKTVNLLEADPAIEPMTDNYSRVYHLPADYIWCWRTSPISFNYRIQGNLVYTNSGPNFKMIYVYSAPPGAFPDYFALYVAYELAAQSALLVTENSSLVQIWEQKAMQQLMLCQNRDSSQQPSDSVAYDPYWAAHGSSWGY